MNVLAVVVTGGFVCPEVHALTPVAGVAMVVRSVRAVLDSGVVDRVHVDSGAVLAACAGLPVDVWQPGDALTGFRAHTGQRARATSGDGDDTESVVLVHDAARPLTPPSLFGAVLDAVRAGHDAVVPALPLTDTVKQVDGDGLVHGSPDRAGLRVVQTPRAFRAHLPDPTGSRAHVVPGDPLAFAVRTVWDLELAELLLEERA